MDRPVTPYQMAVNNVARYIRRPRKDGVAPSLNAFQCSEVLALAFCKIKEDVVVDILTAKVD